MTARFRRVAVFVGTAAIAAGTGVGVAASNDDSASPDRGAPSLAQPQNGGGGGAPPDGGQAAPPSGGETAPTSSLS